MALFLMEFPHTSTFAPTIICTILLSCIVIFIQTGKQALIILPPYHYGHCTCMCVGPKCICYRYFRRSYKFHNWSSYDGCRYLVMLSLHQVIWDGNELCCSHQRERPYLWTRKIGSNKMSYVTKKFVKASWCHTRRAQSCHLYHQKKSRFELNKKF